MIIALLGDARAAGAEARCAGALKSDCLFLSRISTEPNFLEILHKIKAGTVPVLSLDPTLRLGIL